MHSIFYVAVVIVVGNYKTGKNKEFARKGIASFLTAKQFVSIDY